MATITLVGTATGTPAGGVIQQGSVAPIDEALLFQVEYVYEDSLGPPGAVGLARSGRSWSGLGWGGTP